MFSERYVRKRGDLSQEENLLTVSFVRLLRVVASRGQGQGKQGVFEKANDLGWVDPLFNLRRVGRRSARTC